MQSVVTTGIASNEKLPVITFAIPTLNAARHIGRCLSSIRNQNFPRQQIEILVADGGSEDNTLDITRSHNVMALQNPNKLADYGAKLSAQHASGDLFVIFAADNELASKDWVRYVAQIFQANKDLVALWCDMTVGKDDAPINRYYDLIKSDPLTHFLNKNLRWYLEQARVRSLDGIRYYVFDVNPSRPLVWGANGLTYRLQRVQSILLSPGFLGDNDVFQQAIETGKSRVAFVPDLQVYHHHLASLSQWISKWKRNYSRHFLAQLQTRNMNWIKVGHFRGKVIAWFIYSIFPVLSTIHSLYLAIRDKNSNWLYHPLVSFAQAVTLLRMIIGSDDGRLTIANVLFRGTLTRR